MIPFGLGEVGRLVVLTPQIKASRVIDRHHESLNRAAYCPERKGWPKRHLLLKLGFGEAY